MSASIRIWFAVLVILGALPTVCAEELERMTLWARVELDATGVITDIQPMPPFPEALLEPMRERILNWDMEPAKRAGVAVASTVPVGVSFILRQRENGDLAVHSDSVFVGVRPIRTMQPYYPRDAARKRLEGKVVVEFALNKYGRPENIEIKESIPEGVFDKSALKAIKTWRFDLEHAGGANVVPERRWLQEITFRLED